VSDPIVIVGGGLAGQRCVETLRRAGCEESIVMVCGERRRPYDRPPLSKHALLAADAEQALSFRSAAWYEERGIKLRLGIRAHRLICDQRVLALSDGSSLAYRQLLIASGARPRHIALLERCENVSALRTLEDARRLRAALKPGARLAVIGAGFIGQEAASVASRAGVQTTIIEAQAVPLASVLGAEVGAWLAELHRSEGVDLILGEHRIEALLLASGRVVECDHVLVGVGVAPDLNWLTGSGLDTRGVQTDEDSRSEAPDIYAAGDAAAVFDPLLGRHVLGGHWESAARQGTRAAKAMLGLETGPQAGAPRMRAGDGVVAPSPDQR
jgi:3-phenylpropionate/trans-cinnamate dioxygenase ferredoxin reductase subunit